MPRAALSIEMVGPVAFDLPARPLQFDGGRVEVSAHRGAYHTVAAELPRPDVVVALNAGLAAAGYGWAPTLRLVHARGSPFWFTDYSEYSADKAAAACVEAGMRPADAGVVLNPFRAPLRQPMVAGGSVGFPWLSNGFLAGFNVDGSSEVGSDAAAARTAAARQALARLRSERATDPSR